MVDARIHPAEVESQARLARVRLRAGLISPERVRLAAALGRAPARLVVRELGWTDEPGPGDPERSAAFLREWGQEPFLRLIAAWLSHQEATADLAGPFERWIIHPSERPALEARLERMDEAVASLVPLLRLEEPHELEEAAEATCTDLLGSLFSRAGRDELADWALGLRDAVADRVAARERADSR